MTTTDRTELAKKLRAWAQASRAWAEQVLSPGPNEGADLLDAAATALETKEADVEAVKNAITGSVGIIWRGHDDAQITGIDCAAALAIAAMNRSATDIAALKAENARLRAVLSAAKEVISDLEDRVQFNNEESVQVSAGPWMRFCDAIEAAEAAKEA